MHVVRTIGLAHPLLRLILMIDSISASGPKPIDAALCGDPQLGSLTTCPPFSNRTLRSGSSLIKKNAISRTEIDYIRAPTTDSLEL